MNKLPLLVLALAALLSPTFAVEYKAERDFIRLVDVNRKATDQHGDVAVASNGEVYISTKDPEAGLQVFSAEGKFIRNVPGAPNDFHGFVIHREKEGEFIYGARNSGQNILKLTLDGKVVFDIPPSAVPDEFKNKVPPNTKAGPDGKVAKNPNEGKGVMSLTAMDVAPNGDLYVSDGYASDYVHRFDRTGKYLASFGGKKAPYGFKTLHKIAIDTRFTPARIIGVDRANGRVIHMSLDGQFLGVIATDMLLPAALAIQGDIVVIGELKGQITILDKAGQVVAKFGTNSTDEAGKNTPEPTAWRPGMVTAPHGVAFTANGDVLVSEYSKFGRVHKFVRQ